MGDKYPDIITPEVLAKLAHLSDEDLLMDIADTEGEVIQQSLKAEAYKTIEDTSTNPIERKMAYVRRGAAEYGVKERNELIDFLHRVLDARKPKQLLDPIITTYTNAPITDPALLYKVGSYVAMTTNDESRMLTGYFIVCATDDTHVYGIVCELL